MGRAARYSTNRVNLSLTSQIFSNLLSRSRHGILTIFGSKLSLCDHDLFSRFVLHILGAAEHSFSNLPLTKWKTVTQIQQSFGKQGTRSTTNCVVHVNLQNSLQVSSSAPERLDTNITCASCETNGCHDCIKIFPPALRRIVQTKDVPKNENHRSIRHSWDSSWRKT